jgi:hypothetical protein
VKLDVQVTGLEELKRELARAELRSVAKVAGARVSDCSRG